MNSQKTLQIPLWYLVKNHKFGFSDFLCRSLNAFSSQYREEERTILYFLICFYKHDKYVDEIVVTVLSTISEQSQGEVEEQAYEQWPPQVPIFKIIDATLPMFGQQQHYVAYLMSDGF